MLQLAPHVNSGRVAPLELPFAWDEWFYKDYYQPIARKQFQRLETIADKASLGLTLACGEWIVARFSMLSEDPTPLHVLEAAWAAMIDPSYCLYYETDDDEWRGPVRGPLSVVVNVAMDAIFCLGEDPRVFVRACWMSNLARHVLPQDSGFDLWFDFCVERLLRYHSMNSERAIVPPRSFGGPVLLGRPVPREAFSPEFPYDPASTPALLDRFLRALSPRENPHLRAPEQLLAMDEFDGQPYRYGT